MSTYYLAISSNCAFVRLLKVFFFFADSFDPELIKSIVAKLLYINEILKTSCVQFARLCQCSKIAPMSGRFITCQRLLPDLDSRSLWKS